MTSICPDNYTCVPEGDSNRFGKCQVTPATALMGCDPPPAGATCATGLYCRTFDAELSRPLHIDPGFSGMCVPWVREGALCNADAFAEGPGTRQCEPGTRCVTDPNNREVRRCMRPCTSDDDCPCDNPGDPGSIRCLSEGGAPGFCSICIPNRSQCDETEGAPGCCDGMADCLPAQYAGLPAGAMQCCRPPGVGEQSQCTSDEQCCSDALCVNGMCTACGRIGDAPVQGVGCCGSLVTRDGVCARACREDPGSSCSNYPGCQSEWQCTLYGDECVTMPSASDNTCDGLDQDCSGTADEDVVHQACQLTPPNCQPGFVVDSTTRCVDGNNECRLPFRPTWCQHDANGHTIANPGNCYSVQQECAMDSQCTPGERCGPMGNANCGMGVPGCCEFLENFNWVFRKCCTHDSAATNLCWNPGDRHP